MKKVQVLMSTYNGKENIIKQVRSIERQVGVDISLIIRDDGSRPETIDILKRICGNYSNIRIIYGKNIGYKRSFLTLLKVRDKEGFDYYSFSDQDDLWNKNKLYNAIKLLDESNQQVRLYTSDLSMYDESMVYINTTNLSNIPNDLYSLFTRNRFAGCTYVFSKKLAELATGYDELKYSDSSMPAHDFLLASFAYAYGEVIIDNHSYIKHIRYPSSVTSGGNGLKKRLQIEFFNTFKRRDTRKHMAEILLESNDGSLPKRINDYLFLVNNYKEKWRNRVHLMRYMNCGNKIGDLESMFKVLVGNF